MDGEEWTVVDKFSWENPRLDFMGAQWIWYPSERTLANTMILFRKEVVVAKKIRQARGWILGDSRYRLSVNGHRVQWGPAPADPRWPEADPVDLTRVLEDGTNVLGVAVLFYGSGDGTWPTGKPGLIFRLSIEYVDGTLDEVVSDSSWQCVVDRSHPPGQYRRWYLRALQEVVDLRQAAKGWDLPEYRRDNLAWSPAMTIGGSASTPSICTDYSDYSWDVQAPLDGTAAIHQRSIPMLNESIIPLQYVECRTVEWNRNPDDWFEFRTPGSYRVSPNKVAVGEGPWRIPEQGLLTQSMVLTFCLPQGMVGWPQVTVDAPEGTIVELIVAEAHDGVSQPWLDQGFYSWSRFICRGGVDTLEPFDYEGFRWLQIHVRGNVGEVMVSHVAIRQREYPWPRSFHVQCQEPALQRLWQADWNTLRNSAQETVVDGMARERQQYSGDCGHQLRILRLGTGDLELSGRFLNTFSQGMTEEGYFLDTWPAFDRLNRIALKQVGLAAWGPILDHGLGFMFDTWQYYWDTGDLSAIQPVYPRLERFAGYLAARQERQADGLIPVENLGLPVVWLDHNAYRTQVDKVCSFNLYVIAALREALAPLARAFGDEAQAGRWEVLAGTMEDAVVRTFWSKDHLAFVDNLPRLSKSQPPRFSDLTLSLALTYRLGPDTVWAPSLDLLETMPEAVGRSYPANSWWRYRALAQGGRMSAVLHDFRHIWAQLPSVLENQTIQENWHANPDSQDEWSHSPMAPLLALFTEIIGLRALAPGFSKLALAPQLGDIPDLKVTVYTPQGPCQFASRLNGKVQEIDITPPKPAVAYIEMSEEPLAGNERTDQSTEVERRIRMLLSPGTTNHFEMLATGAAHANLHPGLASVWSRSYRGE